MIPLADEVVCTVATLLAASGAQLVRAGSAYAAKLSTITFLLVLLGSKDTTSELQEHRSVPMVLLVLVEYIPRNRYLYSLCRLACLAVEDVPSK